MEQLHYIVAPKISFYLKKTFRNRYFNLGKNDYLTNR